MDTGFGMNNGGIGVSSITTQPKPMTDEQMKRFLATEIQNALFYLDSSENISASRYRNWQYYRGVMDDLPHLKGQSSVKSSEVHDYISMMLPSLLRPFTSGDKLWDYAAPSDQDPEQARTISRYINEVVFQKDNRGKILLNDWAFDALVQKNGVVKVWWHEDRDFQDSVYQWNDAEYMLKGAQLGPDQEITGYDKTQDLQTGQNVHEVQIRKTINTSKVKVAAIPIEEFVISRDARDYDDAILKCHRSWELAGQLIEQGYPPDVVNRLPTYNETRSELTRPGSSGRQQNRQNIGDPSLRKVTVYEGIVKCNYDGQGIRNWYFKAGGQDGGVELLEMEPWVSQIHFCTFCPEPIPHQFVGTCPGDRLSEMQKVNTVLTRQMLQSIYLSNAPQREVVADNILSPDQLTNFTPGASIMVTAVNSVNAVPLPFTGQYALQAIQYFDGMAADRSGVSRTSAGLDPEALQNQSATAANLAWNASMGRLEMVARIWAYTGMKRLGDALLKTVIVYQDFSRAVLLDGKQANVDPRAWSQFVDMEVTVQTGLGTGHRDRDLMFLNQILGMQKEWIQQFGPTPVVNFANLAQTCQRIAESGGIDAPESYFGTIPENWMPQPPPLPQPSPDAVVKSKTELAKAQATQQTDMADISAKSSLKLREQNIQAAVDILTSLLTHHAKKADMPTAYEGTGH